MGWIHNSRGQLFKAAVLYLAETEYKETELLFRSCLVVNNEQGLTDRSLQSIKKDKTNETVMS